MCLITHQKHPKTNDKPIKAYKVVATTPNKNFLWSIIMGSVRYIAPFYSSFEYTKFIRFHRTVSGPIPEAILNAVYQGFHLCLDIESAKQMAGNYSIHESWVIFECEIPVGSKFFIDDDGIEICTNQFKFIRKV